MKIIAELGSNWKSFDDCKNAIGQAKAIGADAIKFQLYTHEELYGMSGDMAGVLPREWIAPLAIKCQATGIEFMCTAFSPDGVRFLDPYVATHKLASSEMCHAGMIDALRETGKPLLVSTGAQTQNDILMVHARLFGSAVTWLYCEAAYPSRHCDLRRMVQLAQLTRHPVGYSDHTLDVFNAPMLAKHMGATVLEKHFNPFDYADTPDAPHSLGTADFKDMVAALAGELKPIGPTPAELPMMLRHKRRWVVDGYAAPGELVHAGLYRMKHDDAEGMHPMLDIPSDARATRPLFPGEALKRSDLG